MNCINAIFIMSFPSVPLLQKFVCDSYIYTPRNEVVRGYTGFTMSIRLSVDKSYVVR